jgi:hypothetical protein
VAVVVVICEPGECAKPWRQDKCKVAKSLRRGCALLGKILAIGLRLNADARRRAARRTRKN